MSPEKRQLSFFGDHRPLGDANCALPEKSACFALLHSLRTGQDTEVLWQTLQADFAQTITT